MDLHALHAELTRNPADHALRHRYADELVRQGHVPHAIHEYQALCGAYALQGQLLQAVATCKIILGLDPAHVETQETLASLYAHRNASEWTTTLPPSMSAAAAEWPIDDDGNLTPSFAPTSAATAPDALHQSVEIVVGQEIETRVEDDALPTETTSEVVVTAELLPRFPLFTDLGKRAFVALFGTLELESHLAGSAIVVEGAPGDCMYAVAEGSVEVFRDDGKVLARLPQGAFFGEMALLSEGPRLASVRASSACVLLRFGKDELMELVKEHPSVGRVLARFYKARLLATMMRACPVLRPLGVDAKQGLAAQCKLTHVKAGAILVEEGQSGDALGVVLRGRCRVWGARHDGTRIDYPDLTEGAVFGEISTLLARPATATVRAETDCVVVKLGKRALNQHVLPHPEVREMLGKIAGDRLQRTLDEEPQSYWVTDQVLV